MGQEGHLVRGQNWNTADCCAPYSMPCWAFEKSKAPHYPWFVGFRAGPHRRVFCSLEFRQDRALLRVVGCMESEMDFQCSELHSK